MMVYEVRLKGTWRRRARTSASDVRYVRLAARKQVNDVASPLLKASITEDGVSRETAYAGEPNYRQRWGKFIVVIKVRGRSSLTRRQRISRAKTQLRWWLQDECCIPPTLKFESGDILASRWAL